MNKLEIWLDKLFVHHRWMIHAFFWLMILFFYAIMFGRENSNYTQTFFFIGLLMPVTIGTTYFLNYYLLPRHLMKEHYVVFIVYFIYTLVISLLLEMMIVTLTFIILAERKMSEMSAASIDLVFLLVALLMIVFLGGAIKLLLHWRKSREDYQKLMLEKVEVELRFLKTQLHPHFLFNTLNNLYYLSLEKSDQTPKAILALGEILDYVLHETRQDTVSLGTELKQVENYIALELLRYSDRLQVEITVEDQVKHQKIAPMMLITLIENSFKHGVSQTAGKSWITLTIKNENESMIIVIENSIPSNAQRKKHGVGLQNLRNQIELSYASKGKLMSQSFEEYFSIKLELPR